jgi:hypothetical protein
VGTRSARDPLRFPPDPDLDLDLVHEIFKVKVKTLTSIFSETVRPTSLMLNQDMVLDVLCRQPEGQGRGPPQGGYRTPLKFRFQTYFSRFFIVRIVCYLAILLSLKPCIYRVIFSWGHRAFFGDNGGSKSGGFFKLDFLGNCYRDGPEISCPDVDRRVSSSFHDRWTWYPKWGFWGVVYPHFDSITCHITIPIKFVQ